jgi:hypothetical protein
MDLINLAWNEYWSIGIIDLCSCIMYSIDSVLSIIWITLDTNLSPGQVIITAKKWNSVESPPTFEI